jgi:hypothetical protein
MLDVLTGTLMVNYESLLGFGALDLSQINAERKRCSGQLPSDTSRLC